MLVNTNDVHFILHLCLSRSSFLSVCLSLSPSFYPVYCPLMCNSAMDLYLGVYIMQNTVVVEENLAVG